jgi:alpha-glucoside transport system permease protein
MAREPKFWEAMSNNMLWLLVVPAFSTAFGLLAAQLTDRISWGGIAKSLIFMPMAISFVGAAVIWKLIYDTRPVGQAQIGVLNAVWLQLSTADARSVLFLKAPSGDASCSGFAGLIVHHLSDAASLFSAGKGAGGNRTGGLMSCAVVIQLLRCWMIWLSLGALVLSALLRHAALWRAADLADHPVLELFFLMVVLIWIQTGFAMVILSAALRGIPEETIEAAVIDGANPFQIFFKIKVPQIMGTIVVVWTTITWSCSRSSTSSSP